MHKKTISPQEAAHSPINSGKVLPQELAGFQEARAITREFSRTFYLASLFLNKKTRYAAYAAYAICRLSDDAVDEASCLKPAEALEKIRNDVARAYSSTPLDNNLMASFRKTVMEYQIPKEYFDIVIEGMAMDLNIHAYATFDDLSLYCQKAAGIIGLIMLQIFGYKDSKAKKFAVDLGFALQLTNVIRDIEEDFNRGRIYFPREDLQKHNIKETDIANRLLDDNSRALIYEQIQRARDYYRACQPGIKMIKGLRNRLVVCAIKDMYAEILTIAEKKKCDVYSSRLEVDGWTKIIIILRVLTKGEYL